MAPPETTPPNVYFGVGSGWADLLKEGEARPFKTDNSQHQFDLGVAYPVVDREWGTFFVMAEAGYNEIDGHRGTLGSYWEEGGMRLGLHYAKFLWKCVRVFGEGKYGWGYGRGEMNFGEGTTPEAQKGWVQSATALLGADYCIADQTCLGPNVMYTWAKTYDQVPDFHYETFTPGVRLTVFWDKVAPTPVRREITIRGEGDVYKTLGEEWNYLDEDQVKKLLAILEDLKQRSEKKGLSEQAEKLNTAIQELHDKRFFKDNLPFLTALINQAQFTLARDRVFGFPVLVLFRWNSSDIDIGPSFSHGNTGQSTHVSYAIDCYGHAELDYFIYIVDGLWRHIRIQQIRDNPDYKDVQVRIKIKGYANDTGRTDDDKNLVKAREETVRRYLQGKGYESSLYDIPLVYDVKVGPFGGWRKLDPAEQQEYKKNLDDKFEEDGFIIPHIPAEKICSYNWLKEKNKIILFEETEGKDVLSPGQQIVEDHSTGQVTSHDYKGPFYRHVAVSFEIVKNGKVLTGEPLYQFLENVFGNREEGEAKFRMAP